jgi:hypothetical protein
MTHPVPCREATPPPAPASRSDLPARNIGQRRQSGDVIYLHPIRGNEFRTWFAPKMAEWLRANFANPEQVAVAFGVRSSTAWAWWNGDNRASGDTVARMFMAFPEAQEWFLAEWEGRE